MTLVYFYEDVHVSPFQQGIYESEYQQTNFCCTSLQYITLIRYKDDFHVRLTFNNYESEYQKTSFYYLHIAPIYHVIPIQ
jgi:hypothetical protein